MHILSLFASFSYSFRYFVFQSSFSIVFFNKSRSKIQEQIKIMSEIYLAYCAIFTRQNLISNTHVLQVHMDLEKMKQITIQPCIRTMYMSMRCNRLIAKGPNLIFVLVTWLNTSIWSPFSIKRPSYFTIFCIENGLIYSPKLIDHVNPCSCVRLIFVRYNILFLISSCWIN
jgi:hypothetical protein